MILLTWANILHFVSHRTSPRSGSICVQPAGPPDCAHKGLLAKTTIGEPSKLPQVSRTASVLAIAFLGELREPGGDYGVLGGVTRVSCNVGGCGGLIGGTGGAYLARRDRTTHLGTSSFDGSPRSVAFRVLFLETWVRVLGAVGSPEHQ